MESTMSVPAERRNLEGWPISHEHEPGVSWSAVIGGAFVAASVSLIMLALGAGFGLSTISPWSNSGASAGALGAGSILWLFVVEVVACALGGYLTGRFRTKWISVHTDEVYFRDTANGFLAWAVSLIVTAAFLGSAAAAMVGNSVQKSANEGVTGPKGYFVDALFRSSAPQIVDPSVKAEAGRILENSLLQKGNGGTDETYLGVLVAARTGLSQADAEKRVYEVVAQAQQAEDTARRAMARLLLWTFLALLMGAFTASYSATIGGKQRDHVKVV